MAKMNIKKNIALCSQIIKKIDPDVKSAWGLSEEQQAALIFIARIFAEVREDHADKILIADILYTLLKPHLNLLNESLALVGNVSMEQRLTHAISKFQLNQLG